MNGSLCCWSGATKNRIRRIQARAARAEARAAEEEREREERERRWASASDFARAERQRLSEEIARLEAWEALWHESEAARAERSALVRADGRAAERSRRRLSRAVRARLRHAAFDCGASVRVGQPTRLRIEYDVPHPLPCPAICLEIFDVAGAHLFTSSNFEHGVRLDGLLGQGELCVALPAVTLLPGVYSTRLRLFADWQEDDWISVLEDECDGPALLVTPARYEFGSLYLPTRWSDDDPGSQAPT